MSFGAFQNLHPNFRLEVVEGEEVFMDTGWKYMSSFSSPFVFCQVLNMTPDKIFYCDLLCVLLFLLLINTHIVICYDNAGKHEEEKTPHIHDTNTNTNR